MNSPKSGFTRIELLALLTALTLLLAVTAPLLASTLPSSTRAACYNNLRQVGGGMHRWASEHNEQVPWFTYVSAGGTKPDPGTSKVATPWIEFAHLSNEISTARVFACPQDAGVKIAEDFSGTAHGFLNSGLRGNALSYTPQYDTHLLRPRGVLMSDRDFRCAPGTTGCPQGGNGVYGINSGLNDKLVMWTNGLHQGFGNLLLADGSVQTVNSAQLKTKLVSGDDNGSLHFAPPR